MTILNSETVPQSPALSVNTGQQWHLSQAARAMLSGGVIACPTEGVWGLGCCWDDEAAIRRILELKQRPLRKGMIVLCSDLADVEHALQPLTAEQRNLVTAGSDTPTTWILPCKDEVPVLVRGKHRSIAVRITTHPLIRELCRLTGPMISTSANPAGRPPALNALRIRQYFGDKVDYILPGALGGHDGPSQIRTLDGQQVR